MICFLPQIKKKIYFRLDQTFSILRFNWNGEWNKGIKRAFALYSMPIECAAFAGTFISIFEMDSGCISTGGNFIFHLTHTECVQTLALIESRLIKRAFWIDRNSFSFICYQSYLDYKWKTLSHWWQIRHTYALNTWEKERKNARKRQKKTQKNFFPCVGNFLEKKRLIDIFRGDESVVHWLELKCLPYFSGKKVAKAPKKKRLLECAIPSINFHWSDEFSLWNCT